MKETHNYVLALKVAKPEFGVRPVGGEVWFGAIKNYIEEGETTSNDQQGDKYEGVFARLKKNSQLVYHYMQVLGDDLEMREDGDCYLLRRTSSRYVCAFCMYGFDEKELEPLDAPYLENGQWVQDFQYKISPEMHKKFLGENTDKSGWYFSIGHFYEALDASMTVPMVRGGVSYDIDPTTEFCVEPDDMYSELFHKRKDLSYQKDVRNLILNKDPKLKGIAIKFDMLPEGSSWFVMHDTEGLNMQFTCGMKPLGDDCSDPVKV